MTIIFSPLAPLEVPGEKLAVKPGDTVRVTTALRYKIVADESTFVTLDGAIGTRQDTEIVPIATGSTTVELPPSADYISVEAAVDIKVGSDAAPGTYSLFVMLREYQDVAAEAADSIEIAAGVTQPDMLSMMMPMMIMIMMMTAILPMMEDEEEKAPAVTRKRTPRKVEEEEYD